MHADERKNVRAAGVNGVLDRARGELLSNIRFVRRANNDFGLLRKQKGHTSMFFAAAKRNRSVPD